MHIRVNDSLGALWSRDVDVAVGADGSIVDSFDLPPTLIALYDVTATGNQTGRVATTTFTDGVERDFMQAANNDAGYAPPIGFVHWIGSILQQSNSVYYEGMSVPQRMIMPNLPVSVNDQHSFSFHVDWSKGGTHAYDFITSWAQSDMDWEDAGIDQIINIDGETIPAGYPAIVQALISGGNFLDVVVPDDPFVSKDGAVQDKIDAYEAIYGSETSVRIYANAPITAASMDVPTHDVANGGDTGDSAAFFKLNWTSNATQVMILWAGHLAVSVDGTDVGWGPMLGAGAIPGGPYHWTLDELGKFEYDRQGAFGPGRRLAGRRGQPDQVRRHHLAGSHQWSQVRGPERQRHLGYGVRGRPRRLGDPPLSRRRRQRHPKRH